MVLNQQAQSGRHNPVLPQHGCAASSKVNRCFAFPGQLRHGAVALPNCSEEVRSGQKRSVVLYNFWPKGTPRTSECVQPDFSNYTPICSWAPTARHLLCETCLQRLQEEPCTAQRVELMDLTQPEDMDHSVPMEEPPDWLPVCGPNLLKTHGAVHFQWRLAANLYLAGKKGARLHGLLFHVCWTWITEQGCSLLPIQEWSCKNMQDTK